MTPAKRSRNKHARIRSDHATELAEDYVEAIAAAIKARGKCRAVNLVDHFQVSHVTVNRTIGRLRRDGYVVAEPYGPIELTDAGKHLARASRRRHEVVYRFLVAIGVNASIAAADSEGIEHHVSPETLAAMRAFLTA